MIGINVLYNQLYCSGEEHLDGCNDTLWKNAVSLADLLALDLDVLMRTS